MLFRYVRYLSSEWVTVRIILHLHLNYENKHLLAFQGWNFVADGFVNNSEPTCSVVFEIDSFGDGIELSFRERKVIFFKKKL